jgi:lysophospholipase L1-like esterase
MNDKSTSIVNLGNLDYLANVFEKVEKENALSIVYLGGSITQGCHADSEEKRYVNLSAQWWNDTFPTADISFFNAGIGATTSQYGVARAENHVLDKNPDLVFVEFSVNDDDNMKFMETYESLVRKLLSADSVKAVILINNLFYDTGANAQGIHNAVGLHYQLPIVSVRDFIYPEIQLGNIDVNGLTGDMLHPNTTGHRMISELVRNLLDEEYKYYKKLGKTGGKPKLPEKLTPCRYEDSYIINNQSGEVELNGFRPDTHASDYFSDPFKNGWLASHKGNSVTIPVDGNIISVQWRRTINKPAPVATAVIDGDDSSKIILDANFDEDWGDLCCLTTLTEKAGKGRHTVKITVETEGKQDSDFMLISVIGADK